MKEFKATRQGGDEIEVVVLEGSKPMLAICYDGMPVYITKEQCMQAFNLQDKE
jgi:hypothetical protein